MALWMCRLGYTVLVIALVLCIVGEAIPYWYYGSMVPDETIYYGLWKKCVVLGSFSSCAGLVEISNVVYATRALEIIGILTGIAALCVLRIRNHLPYVNQIAGGMAILAGILMLIGTIVYGTDSDVKQQIKEFLHIQPNLHIGFALCVVAGVLSMFGGALIFTLQQEYIEI